MTENAANASAAVIAKRWENIVRIWTGAYQPALTALGKPFADTPHWDAEIERHEPTTAEIKEFRDRSPSSDEIAEAHGPIIVNNDPPSFSKRADATHPTSQKS
ncbi:MAG TPA: hypothetical protein VG269_19750 [Tepidisphaeraceae bacterium]|nr:hypothetical protein [Tepidisphaeraceae bacterium]